MKFTQHTGSSLLGQAGDKLNLFTDGSSSDSAPAGGWAWVCPRLGVWHAGAQADDQAQISSRMEAAAALEAVKATHPQAQVVVFTDCQSLVAVFNAARGGKPLPDKWVDSPLAELLELSAGRQVALQWMRGHRQSVPNGIVDRLSYHAMRAAAQGQEIDPAHLVAVAANVQRSLKLEGQRRGTLAKIRREGLRAAVGAACVPLPATV